MENQDLIGQSNTTELTKEKKVSDHSLNSQMMKICLTICWPFVAFTDIARQLEHSNLLWSTAGRPDQSGHWPSIGYSKAWRPQVWDGDFFSTLTLSKLMHCVHLREWFFVFSCQRERAMVGWCPEPFAWQHDADAVGYALFWACICRVMWLTD